MNNLDFLEQIAKRLDELDIPNILLIGSPDDELEELLKGMGCVTTWVKTLVEAQEQIEAQHVKVIFVLGNRSVGLGLVKWLTVQNMNIPVVFLSTDKRSNELQDTYPVTVMNSKNKSSKVRTYMEGLHHTGMAL